MLVASVLWVALGLPLIGARLASQFEATCPKRCHCTRDLFKCENLHAKEPNAIFPHASPIVFPELSTLVVTGNDFGDLRGENLFGEGQKNKKVSLANLTNSGITAFDGATFEGLTGVEYLYLSENNLTEVGQSPFKHMPKLKILDLSNVFGRGVSVQVKADILRDLFKQNDDRFVELNEILLNDNGIEFLHPDTFCQVRGLARIQLENNRLKEFPISQEGKCLPSLKNLNLRANHFERIPNHLYNGPVELTGIDVSYNPLKCDCEAKDFVKYAQDEDSFYINQDFTTCASPSNLKHSKVFQIELEDLCSSGGHHYFLLILLVLFLGAYFGYRYARAHNINIHLPTPSRIPLVAGYSALKSNDDGTVPQFV
ncbi:hypothetical protein L596_006899 [Steinernema carpocapsae]|uniref:LRRCT domain-containing protein n=1 Tax=Steinernema carpocapsae TaxID=34508 RepID=A0A4U5P896_STECR|nr:hypothetical protein L596_006899 [Steinernema carpocapsae]